MKEGRQEDGKKGRKEGRKEERKDRRNLLGFVHDYLQFLGTVP